MNSITINNIPLQIREYKGHRVVTFKDIDTVHERPDGTARRRFSDNKKHFIEGVDFFKVKCSEVRPFFGQTPPKGFNPKADLILVTESGYLMLVKSFTDDHAWQVQRKLVNTYFRAKEIINEQAERIDPQAAYTGAQRLGDVVELAKLTVRLMENAKRHPADIAQTVGAQLAHFGIPGPYSESGGNSMAVENVTPRCETVTQFLLEFGSVMEKTVGEVYNAYLDYCNRTGITPIRTTYAFGAEIVKQTGIHTKSRRQNGKAVRVYTK